MPLETFPFDASEFLDDEASMEDYLAEAFATRDADTMAYAIGVVARARGITQIAHNSGRQREELYHLLSPLGRAELNVMMQRGKQLA